MQSPLPKNTIDIGPLIVEYKAMTDAERKGPRGKVIINTLVTKYYPLVRNIVETTARRKPLPPQLQDLEDLMQAGYEGLLKAPDKFTVPLTGNPGAAFTVYVKTWIKREVQLVTERFGTVHRSRQESMPGPLVRFTEAYQTEHGTPPGPEELGITPKKFAQWRNIPRMVGIDGGPKKYSRHILHPIRISISNTATDGRPSPEVATASAEATAKLEALSPVQRQIVALSVRGFTNLEISGKVDRTVAHVKLVVNRARAWQKGS